MTEERKYHPVEFAYTNVKGGPSSDDAPDPVVLEMMQRNLTGLVLEIGGGDGRYQREVLRENPDIQIVATDIRREALTTLRVRVPDEDASRVYLVVLDAFKPLPFGGKTFDGAVCTALLHLRKPRDINAAAREIHRVTRPGGVLVADLSTDIRRTDQDGGEKRGEHEAAYSYRRGRAVLREALDDLFDIKQISTSAVSLDLATVNGPVHLTTRKVNVVGRRK